ncbi:elongator complex protein 2-like [Anneissia japonica]|uniref:elongator complex protein 2-like n=1 Tax=Anneissia japonica TaxID=1529436 RepID=UPI0014257B6A|nr:elongator complex protein 2-like [Anneissia japonica]
MSASIAKCVETCYVSAGCNCVPHCVHWSHQNVVAYASNRNIILYDPGSRSSTGKIISVLQGHKVRVNCVKWVQEMPSLVYQTETVNELISASSDQTIKIWTKNGDQYEVTSTLAGHDGIVTIVDAIYLHEEGQSTLKPRTLIASTSTDSTIKIWERRQDENEFKLLQTISRGKGFALCLAWCVLPTTNTAILTVGDDDCKLLLYVESGGQFVKVNTLQGHEDWVRAVQAIVTDDGDLLLASCGQDFFIRLWRISPEKEEALDNRNEEIKIEGNTFSVMSREKTKRFNVSLESVLLGHENWVYDVHWKPAVFKDGVRHQPMCLVSASMDKTMIIWRLDADSGIWMDSVRVGEVGGNTLGLYGCQFSPTGDSILGHGFQGAFHLWHTDGAESDNGWSPGVVVSGHFGSVEDIDWDPQNGDFLLSVGMDQTTRLHAPWIQSNSVSWHEIARPQVHGYDMQCISMVSRNRFVSGADEKVVRVFDAPINFLQNFSQLSKIKLTGEELEKSAKNAPMGASVPALGLSNKAVYEGESMAPVSDREINHPSELYSEIYFSSVSLNQPPTEEHLLQNSLWPETQKLYGHGFEIFCLASHPSGTVVASACKATRPEHAAIILWDTSTWKQLCQLPSHSLTITQLAFSHDGEHLLSVSRDRTWSLFRRRPNSTLDGPLYSRVAFTDKKTAIHGRIIWACSWSHDDNFFATASRDKKVIIWGKDSYSTSASCLGNYKSCSSPLDVKDAATAIAFAPVSTQDGSYLLSIGTESGAIKLFKWHPATTEWNLCFDFDQSLRHSLTVKRLRWRPRLGRVGSQVDNAGNSDEKWLQLASCSNDCSVKIYNIKLNEL